MNGNLMYEMARQRIADQQRTTREATEARKRAKVARGRHARAAAAEPAVLPAIPDFAHELLDGGARGAVPAQRPEAGRGRHARTGK
jgi:hypothetical protein